MAGSVRWLRNREALPGTPRDRLAGRTLLEALTATVSASYLLYVQWPYGFNWGDEGLLWYLSQRARLGEVPLRDFFSYDPGRYFWSAIIFKALHGDGLYEQILANDLFGLIALVAIYLAMCQAGIGRRWRIPVLLLLAFTLAFPRHKIFEQALSLWAVAALAFVMARPAASRRWFFYGALQGLAAFVGRNSGLYLAVGALLVALVVALAGAKLAWKPALGCWLLGTAVGYSPLLLMLFFIHGFASAFYRSLRFAPNWQLAMPIPFPWHVHLKGLATIDVIEARSVSLLCLAVPMVYGFALCYWFKRGAESDGALGLAAGGAIGGLPYLHHAFSRADFFHIAQGILPSIVTTGALAHHFWAARRRGFSVLLFAAMLMAIVAAWLPYEPGFQFFRMRAENPEMVRDIEIRGRRFSVLASEAAVLNRVRAAFADCGGGDGSFLAAPYYPGLYAYLKTKAPFWELYYVYPRDEDFQRRHIQALEENHTSLVLLNRQARMDGLERLRIERTYPELVRYIVNNYHRVDAPLPEGFELYDLPARCRVGS